jgi:preprotein translocase subunit SecB
MSSEPPKAAEPPKSPPAKQLLLQRIYLKDLSFESPRAPEVFTGNVKPQTELNIKSSARELAPAVQEVTLTITIEAKDEDRTLFLVEVQQAGVFLMQGYSNEERAVLIGSFCPSTLYPFAREAVSDIVVRGGFPQLLLQPINFEALYAQAVKERGASGNGGRGEGAPRSGEAN